MANNIGERLLQGEVGWWRRARLRGIGICKGNECVGWGGGQIVNRGAGMVNDCDGLCVISSELTREGLRKDASFEFVPLFGTAGEGPAREPEAKMDDFGQ